MRSLCHALLGRHERSEPRPEDMLGEDLDHLLEGQADESLERDVIAEFDRYRRMDEWSSSYQNLYSRTALDCQRQMMQAKIQEVDLMRFIPYTRAGTYDLLRIQAFECLVDLDISQSPDLQRWLTYTMTNDSSAYVRHHCQRLFGRALAQIAFGRPLQPEVTQTGGLIIEQESSTEVRQADLARRQTVPGAIDALKKEISGDPSVQEYIWSACNSRVISVHEISELADVCRALFDPATAKIIRLRYPRFWRVENLGNGKLRFHRSGSVRTSLVPSRDSSKRKREEHGMQPPPPRITFKQSKTSHGPGTPSSTALPKIHIPNPSPTPAKPSTPAASTPSTPASGGLKLKLKFGQKK